LLIYPTNINYVTIKLNNSCDTTPILNNGKLITTKEKSSIHGYGIKSIKRIVKNYDGNISFEYDELENIFCVKIVLKVNN
jgi:sensor histidine kinase regulating citrate/malate metabolism